MVNIIVVSHSKALANAVVEFASEMKGDDFQIEAVSGIDGDEHAMGSDPIKILEAIKRLDTGDGVLLLADIGSSVMNAGMAVELLNGGGNAVIADAPLVEGALAAASYNAKGVSLDILKNEAESARHIPKL